MPEAVEATCRTCPHWEAHGLICRRYPRWRSRMSQDWCGEHPERQTHELHAVFAPGTLQEMNAAIDETLDEQQAEAKRGGLLRGQTANIGKALNDAMAKVANDVAGMPKIVDERVGLRTKVDVLRQELENEVSRYQEMREELISTRIRCAELEDVVRSRNLQADQLIERNRQLQGQLDHWRQT